MGTGKTVRTDSVPVFPGFFLVFPVETVFGPENWYTVPVGMGFSRPVFNPTFLAIFYFFIFYFHFL